MKKIIAFLLIATLILSCSCTKKDDEDAYLATDESTEVQDDEATNKESSESSKADENKQNESSSDDKQNDSEVKEQNPQQKPSENKDESNQKTQQNQEQSGEQNGKPEQNEEQNQERDQEDKIEPIYDDSNATPATSFEYETLGNEIIINKFVGTETNIIIPNIIDNKPVTTIQLAFGESNIKSVVIPLNVVCIYDYCFLNCQNLESIEIKGSLTRSLGSHVFENCTKLKKVILHDNVEKLSSYAFENCSSLEEIVIPAKINFFGECTFLNCKNLKKVTFANGIEEISGWSIFMNCGSIETLIIPASVKIIASQALDGCTSLKSIYFEGDAPVFEGDYLDIGDPYKSELQTIYYKKGTKGWDTTPLKKYKMQTY